MVRKQFAGRWDRVQEKGGKAITTEKNIRCAIEFFLVHLPALAIL